MESIRRYAPLVSLNAAIPSYLVETGINGHLRLSSGNRAISFVDSLVHLRVNLSKGEPLFVFGFGPFEAIHSPEYLLVDNAVVISAILLDQRILDQLDILLGLRDHGTLR